MRRLVVSLLAMLVLLTAVDRVLGTAMDHLFRSSTADEDGDAFRRAIAARAPIVVCGSSRAQHHYMVDTLSVWLGERAWNLGRGGSWGALYQYGSAGIVLRHYTPRLWILEVEPATLYEPELLDRLACFLPYVDEEPAAREVVLLRSRYERVRLLSHAYRYNSLLLPLLSTRLGKHPVSRDGFLPLHGEYRPEPSMAGSDTVTGTARAPDPLKVRYLERTIALLRSRGVAVLAVRSPCYLAGDVDRALDTRHEARLRTWFEHAGVRYLDLSPIHCPEFGDASLYKDATHLNERGAYLMTHVLADSLRAMGLARPG